MLEKDGMETASKAVTLIRRQNDIEKSMWRNHRYFIDFESRIRVEISTSNQCHNFHVDSPLKIGEISTNFPRGISTSNRWRINKHVSIGLYCDRHLLRFVSLYFPRSCLVLVAYNKTNVSSLFCLILNFNVIHLR